MTQRSVVLLLGLVCTHAQGSTLFMASASAFASPPGSGSPSLCSQTSISAPITCSASANGQSSPNGNSYGQANADVEPFAGGAELDAFAIAVWTEGPNETADSSASASFSMDITFLGQPAGTQGYVSVSANASANYPIANAGFSLPDTFTNNPNCTGAMNQWCSPFTYGTSFPISAFVVATGSDDESRAGAHIGNFLIYDQNFHQLGASGPDANGDITVSVTAPEPTTALAVALAGLLLIGAKRRFPTSTRIQSGSRDQSNPMGHN
jgi:hypothetical protein